MAKGKSVKDPDRPKKESSKGKAKDGGARKPAKPTERGGMRVVVRVLGTDVDGEKTVKHAILRIKGVSHAFANAICEVAKIDPDKKLGSFTESEIAELEKVLKDPAKYGVPSWLLNRRKDIETGADMHVTSSDVDVSRKFDIQRMIDKKTYKGTRHMLGLPVRGQRTRSSFRRGRTVGVIRKSVRLAAGGTGVTKKERKKRSGKVSE